MVPILNILLDKIIEQIVGLLGHLIVSCGQAAADHKIIFLVMPPKSNSAPKKSAKKNVRKVYSESQKKAVLEAIEKAGRGGAADVAKKFGVSLPTIYVWKRQAGGGRAANAKQKSDQRTQILQKLITLSKEIDVYESKLSELNNEFAKLKKSL